MHRNSIICPNPAHPELVEGLSFSCDGARRLQKEEQCFDKLSMSGIGWQMLCAGQITLAA
jgi:hypothetical protein